MTRHSLRLRRFGVIALFFGALLAPALTITGGSVHAAGSTGAVYSLTNAAAGNAVIVYTRAADGSLSSAGADVSTGGRGSGAGLGSQGALILSDDGAWLFAVNAGSNTISSFSVGTSGVHLVSQAPSGGIDPISLSFSHGLLYVLNAGSSAIAGFTVGSNGVISQAPIPGSVQQLSAAGTSPEEITFNPTASVLLVTEKGGGQVESFIVNRDGSATGPYTYSTGAVGPYAIAWDANGNPILADAGIGALSSYTLSPLGLLHPISLQVPDSRAAPCWIVVTSDGKYAFTANAHDGTISSYSVGAGGNLTLIKSVAAGPVAVPLLDLALSNDNQYLYGVDAGSTVAYRIGPGGSLTPMADAAGKTAGQGLAAW
jgi:6-phosphogluconolactonase